MESSKYQRQVQDLQYMVEDIEHHISDSNPEEVLELIDMAQSSLKSLKHRMEKELEEG